MAKEYAQNFYNSTAWKACREAYKSKRGYLCERCLAKGLYVPGIIVHHKIRISPKTLDDPSVALNHDNLELLCRECHEAEHSGERAKREAGAGRYRIDEYGRVIINDENEKK